MEENTAGKKATGKPQDRSPAVKFKAEKLREKSVELFGVTTSTFDGAMYQNKQKELSVEEAGNIIDTWLHGKGGKNNGRRNF